MMMIEIQYSVSEAPHKFELSQQELDTSAVSGSLTFSQPTPKGHKTLTLTGSKKELLTLAIALVRAAL